MGVSHYIVEGQVNDMSKKALGTIQILRKGIPLSIKAKKLEWKTKSSTSGDFDDIATINGYHVAKEAGLSVRKKPLAAIADTAGHVWTPTQWTKKSRVWALAMGQPGWSVQTKCCHQCGRSGKGIQIPSLNYYRQLTALYRHPLMEILSDLEIWSQWSGARKTNQDSLCLVVTVIYC